MDKLSAMRAFVEIARQGSLTKAGVVLGKSQPTMVRTLANLEEALGVRLVRRTTRRMALTEEGRGYLARCERILADIDEAEQALSAGQSDPKGFLRVTAPVAFGQWHVAGALRGFLARHQQMRVELLLLDRVTNLLEEGIDLAVRIGPLEDSGLIAAPVGEMRRVVVASPGLLERVGTPTHPKALADLPCVGFHGISPGGVWRLIENDKELIVRVGGPFLTNHAVTAVEACAAGLGFGAFLAYQVAPQIESGELEVVLAAFERPAQPVSLLYTDTRLMTPRLRTLVEYLKGTLGQALAAL